MRNKLRLFVQLSLSLVDQAVVSACTFLTMVLISYFGSKAEVGLYALLVSIINLIRTVQERIITAPYLAFAFREGFDRPSYQGSSYVHQAGLTAFATVSTCFVACIGYLLGCTWQWTIVLASFAFALPLLLLRDQIRAMAAARFQFTEQLFFDVAVVLTQLLGISVLGWWNQFSIIWVIFILGIACALPSLVWFMAYGRTIQIRKNDVISDWKNNWAYSRWLIGARVFGIFGYFIVPWLVWYFLDEASTGAYAVCSSLVGISHMFMAGLNNLFQPRTIRELHRRGVGGMLYAIGESIVIVVGILGVLSLGFFWMGSQALAMIFKREYGDYGYLVFLLSLSTLAVSFSVLFGNGLAALSNSREYFWGEFACCFVSVSAALTLIPIYGLNGAAISLILGGAAASAVTGWTLYRLILRIEPPAPGRDDSEPDCSAVSIPKNTFATN
jgi:O-antigen/teichoic acid export membrane protein